MKAERPVPAEPVKTADDLPEAGGDPVCWAHLVCAECGAIVSEGHRDGCESAARGEA
jgi:hypothetical protein